MKDLLGCIIKLVTRLLLPVIVVLTMMVVVVAEIAVTVSQVVGENSARDTQHSSITNKSTEWVALISPSIRFKPGKERAKNFGLGAGKGEQLGTEWC